MESTQPKPKGLITGSIHTLCLLVFISLFAWGLLIMGFALQNFFKGDRAMQQHMQLLLKSNTHVLKNSSSQRVKNIYAYLQHWENNLINQGKIKTNHIMVRIHASNADWKFYLPTLHNKAAIAAKKVMQRTGSIVWGATLILANRLCIFILALPLFLLCLSVGIVDGLVQRDIRKFQGARESAFIFHWIKLAIGFCLFFPFFIYLVCPWPLSSLWFLVTMAMVMGGLVQMGLRSFKKYL